MVWVHLNTLVLFLLHQTFKCLCVVKIKSVVKCRAFTLLHKSFLSLHFIFHWERKLNLQPTSTSNGKPKRWNGAVGTTPPATKPSPRASLWELLREFSSRAYSPLQPPTSPGTMLAASVGGVESFLHGEQDKVAPEWIDAHPSAWRSI